MMNLSKLKWKGHNSDRATISRSRLIEIQVSETAFLAENSANAVSKVQGYKLAWKIFLVMAYIDLIYQASNQQNLLSHLF